MVAGKVNFRDEGVNDHDSAVETPATGRTKKGNATPSTGPATGAGVKKRSGSVSALKRAASTPGSGGRSSRKAKSQALMKLEEGIDLFDDIYDDDEDDDDQTIGLSTPTKSKGKSADTATGGKSTKKDTPAKREGPIKAEPDNDSAQDNIDYSTFPAVLPPLVLQRKAILVNVCGNWTTSPAAYKAHKHWLSGLPALTQTQFYKQEAATLKAAGTDTESGPPKKKKKRSGNSEGDNRRAQIEYNLKHYGAESAGAALTQAQLMSANFRRDLEDMQALAPPAIASPMAIPGLGLAGMGLSSLGIPPMGTGMGMTSGMGMASGLGSIPGANNGHPLAVPTGGVSLMDVGPDIGNARRGSTAASGSGSGNGRRAGAAPVIGPDRLASGRGFYFGNKPDEKADGNGDNGGEEDNGPATNSFMEQMEARDKALLFDGGGDFDEEEEGGYQF